MTSNGGFALVVSDAPGAAVVQEALSGALPVKVCPGPQGSRCPALKGEPCALRDGAAVSVVYLAREGGFPTLPCATISETPTVVVLEGVDLQAAASDGFALVGANRGAVGVMTAVAKLIDAS